MRTREIICGPAAAALLLVAACGGIGTDTTPPGTGTTPPGGGTTPPGGGTTPPGGGTAAGDGGDGGRAMDDEGITKIYADDPAWSSQRWFLSKNGPLDSGDRRLGFKGTVKNLGSGVFQITPTSSTHPASARVYVGTTNPKWSDQNAQVAGGADWRKLIQNGYMIGPEDYRDAEVTAYYKITKSSNDDEMTFYWRGGAHPSSDQYPLQCIAVCMKAQIQMKDCSPRAAKEYDHYKSPASYAWNDTVAPMFDLKAELGGSMVGKLIGQKLVMYDVKDAAGNVTAVKMELYVDIGSKDLEMPDPALQNWRLLAEYTDDGHNWPDPSQETYVQNCHATKGQLIRWGGPYIALRLDDNVWNLYKLSIRPILPVKSGGNLNLVLARQSGPRSAPGVDGRARAGGSRPRA